MKYTEQFMETCFSFEEANKLRYAFGAALYGAEEIMGKVIVLYGKAGTGKTSILSQFRWFANKENILVYDDCDLKHFITPDVSNDEIMFLATNYLPDEPLEEYVGIIRTSGDRMSFDDYKKFMKEMFYFPEEFFKSCMKYYASVHSYGINIMDLILKGAN